MTEDRDALAVLTEALGGVKVRLASRHDGAWDWYIILPVGWPNYFKLAGMWSQHDTQREHYWSTGRCHSLDEDHAGCQVAVRYAVGEALGKLLGPRLAEAMGPRQVLIEQPEVNELTVPESAS